VRGKSDRLLGGFSMFARLARPDTFDCTTSGTLGTFNFIVRLQVDPELIRRIEVPGQPQRGVDRDPASTSVHSYAVPLGASLYAGLAYDFLRFLSRPQFGEDNGHDADRCREPTGSRHRRAGRGQELFYGRDRIEAVFGKNRLCLWRKQIQRKTVSDRGRLSVVQDHRHPIIHRRCDASGSLCLLRNSWITAIP